MGKGNKGPRPSKSTKNHALRGALATVTHDGTAHNRWQYELPGGARIWYYVHGRIVVLEQVHTHHPNATK